ncbi:hypothetical protein MKW98_010738 [Papaver atlanticum]|uniref:Uncharacterized protein n=1 Tax=Papaver atlanticum TaxID=357466 RepID=A0AAD4XDM3_9MAGN|nr:hypothetical protein MKW98_010738 [Papaver atlanticum]
MRCRKLLLEEELVGCRLRGSNEKVLFTGQEFEWKLDIAGRIIKVRFTDLQYRGTGKQGRTGKFGAIFASIPAPLFGWPILLVLCLHGVERDTEMKCYASCAAGVKGFSATSFESFSFSAASVAEVKGFSARYLKTSLVVSTTISFSASMTVSTASFYGISTAGCCGISATGYFGISTGCCYGPPTSSLVAATGCEICRLNVNPSSFSAFF